MSRIYIYRLKQGGGVPCRQLWIQTTKLLLHCHLYICTLNTSEHKYVPIHQNDQTSPFQTSFSWTSNLFSITSAAFIGKQTNVAVGRCSHILLTFFYLRTQAICMRNCSACSFFMRLTWHKGGDGTAFFTCAVRSLCSTAPNFGWT